jgi:flagellar biosynthesis protein FlhG
LRLREEIPKLEADYVVVDLGPGTREATLDLFLDAHVGIAVTTAEPTAVELSYRLMKSAFVRLMRRSDLGQLAKMSVEEARDFEGGIPAPSDLLARARARYEEGSEEVMALQNLLRRYRPQLCLNTARSKSDMDLGGQISVAAARRFGVAVDYLGPVEYDDAVWVSLRRRRPLLVEHPESRASKCIEKLTRRLLARESKNEPLFTLPGNSYYELFGIEPTASDEQVRRANRSVRQIYAKDSVVVGGLYSKARLEKLRHRLEDGYETLMDPAKRRAYDHELFPDGIPVRSERSLRLRTEPSLSVPAEERPPMPDFDEDVVFTGELMRQVREARGLNLREISDRTKIGLGYLEAIEGETFGKLPAPVYVRGFLVEYAKMLELDVPRVLDTYLPRFRKVRAEVPMQESW